MTNTLRIVLILASLFTFVYVIYEIRKHKLNIDDAIPWILWSILLILASIFSEAVVSIAKAFGFQSANNFIFTAFIFYLYMLNFFNSIKLSEAKEKNKRLVQKLSLERAKKK